jgi:hypothetical protein
MAITAIAPAQYADGAESDDLEDVTHACVQCGTTVSMRRLSGDSNALTHPRPSNPLPVPKHRQRARR